MNAFEQFEEVADRPKGGGLSGVLTNSSIEGTVFTAVQGGKEDVVNVVEEPRPLWQGREPLYTLKAERPEHRIVIMLAATGMGNKEMSEHLAAAGYRQYTPQAIAYIRKQPWAVKQILEEIEKAGREPVKMLLQSSCYEAAETLTDLMKEAESEMVKKQAAESILDRAGFGKNINITTTSNPAEMSDADLRNQLERELRTSKSN